MISITLASYMNSITKLVLGLLYLDLFCLCTYTLSCANYIPTLSFLATFRVHDTIVVLAYCLFALSLIPVFVGVHVKAASILTLDDSVYLLILELGIIGLCITDGIVDESNGIEFSILDYLHLLISCFLSSASVVYISSVVFYMQQLKLTMYEKKELKKCKIMLVVGTVLLILTMVEWHFAHTIYNNWIFNTYLETLFEWTLVTLAIRFPVHLSRVLGYSIVFQSQEKLA